MVQQTAKAVQQLKTESLKLIVTAKVDILITIHTVRAKMEILLKVVETITVIMEIVEIMKIIITTEITEIVEIILVIIIIMVGTTQLKKEVKEKISQMLVELRKLKNKKGMVVL